MQTVQINGLTFNIDTSDWQSNGADADACADRMVSMLRALPADVLARGHADLLLDSEGDIFNACDLKKNADFWTIQEIGTVCKNEIMADFFAKPDSGYNAGISAL